MVSHVYHNLQGGSSLDDTYIYTYIYMSGHRWQLRHELRAIYTYIYSTVPHVMCRLQWQSGVAQWGGARWCGARWLVGVRGEGCGAWGVGRGVWHGGRV